jgi:hypothetical protein
MAPELRETLLRVGLVISGLLVVASSGRMVEVSARVRQKRGVGTNRSLRLLGLRAVGLCLVLLGLVYRLP